MPEISVIVPVYKAEKTLSRCVDSILHQTLQDIELILVDDGSPDRSGAICDEYAGLDSRVRVIHKPNGGAASARNAALEIVAGKYIMFCDSDDYVSPEWCQWLYEPMEQGDVHVAVCGMEAYYEESKKDYMGLGPRTIIPQQDFLKMAYHVSLYITCNKIFKARLVREHGLRFREDLERCEDVFFTLRYFQLIGPEDRFCYGSPPLYHYDRTAETSLSKRYISRYWDVECERLAQTRALLELLRIPAEEAEAFYSEKAAFFISDAVENVFQMPELTFFKACRDLHRITASPEYGAAVRNGSFSRVAGGLFLKLLNRAQPVPLCAYYLLSRWKRKRMEVSNGT
ncbi:MAG: glycosyltransferase family 2 protein [Oscillospiraceae bacterium]|nr:glycosyltransferase family 2 protein [Oscillospiraceae bacterium]